MQPKPQLSFWQIWNMCFGFLGIQFGFALQNANVSRIFETLGADYKNMAVLWVAAPVTGLIVQPIIGYLSDNTWNALGRRRPFFLGGAIAASLALFVMPNSPTLWVAAGMLWVMDASINISMEPFRAFVGDNLPPQQRGFGYAMQSFFIGVGAVVASSLPWMMSNWFGISNVAEAGVLPDSVKYAFYAGGAIFLIAVAWTVFTSFEYSPEELASFEQAEQSQQATQEAINPPDISFYLKGGSLFLGLGVIAALVIVANIDVLDKNLFIAAGMLVAFGLCQLISAYMAKQGNTSNGFYAVVEDLFTMPTAMRQLAWVQFFSWFAFFAMWIYTTSAVTSYHFNSQDPTSSAYAQGADWVGVLFSTYNGTAIFAALLIPILVRFCGLKLTHMINLLLGGLGFISFMFIDSYQWLVASMIGVGFAWASVLSVPYAILSNALPANKMGVYMGIFNFFIVIPQILAASILGFLVSKIFAGEPVYALVTGGVSMLLAAGLTIRVQQPE